MTPEQVLLRSMVEILTAANGFPTVQDSCTTRPDLAYQPLLGFKVREEGCRAW